MEVVGKVQKKQKLGTQREGSGKMERLLKRSKANRSVAKL
jgi:hypothetical protein